MPEKRTRLVSAKFKPSEFRDLQTQADLNDMTLSSLIREAVKTYLKAGSKP